jgi:hypothetical protein
MVANNVASKEGRTTTDANNIEEGIRTFAPEPTPTTCATNRSFSDVFRKVNDARCRPEARSWAEFSPRSLFANVRWCPLAPTTDPRRHSRRQEEAGGRSPAVAFPGH